ncbi:MAG: hypothetical protein R3E12_19245 [Candidatus Eisenbacteria bacterium]
MLCDAIADAVEEITRWSTSRLTGAARIALGPDLPGYFCNDDAIAGRLEHFARDEQDPLWRLPALQTVPPPLDSPIADINNAPRASGCNRSLPRRVRTADPVDPLRSERLEHDPRPDVRWAARRGIRAVFRLLEEIAHA